MTADQIIKRLEAWAAGKPLPRGSTRHVHIADNRDLLILAFVRMGGESSPWGIAWGPDGTIWFTSTTIDQYTADKKKAPQSLQLIV